MRWGRRIRTIYTKELVELLRDRRTLIAMIVVPIALYPLLIIGSVHLLSAQGGAREIREMLIAVENAPATPGDTSPVDLVLGILNRAQSIHRANLDQADAEAVEQRVESVAKMKVLPVDDVKQAVVDGRCDIGVILGLIGQEFPQHSVDFVYDQAELRSESALNRLRSAFETVADDIRSERMRMTGTAPSVVEPIVFSTTDVATPLKVGGMLLGSIVPLVLVLMTITGAIYPAIDLTAGERERGTLETLIVCPVPPIELITGKYLVVTTIAMLGAMLNLLSMGATLYFGGFTEVVGQSGATELPLGVLPVILVALVPFALLFSAIMVAVCSYARTFKEAQNYIMPVILAALIPGGVAALPGTELTGVNSVVPVMNMVLMARQLLLGHYEWGKITLVMLSTSFYAVTAVVIASRVFSTEAVVFADSASLRSVFSRRMMRPAPRPSVSLVLIVVAVLFPTWMFVQFAIQPGAGESVLTTFRWTALCLPVFFVMLPVSILAFFKINLTRTLSLGLCRPRYLLGAVLIGMAAWIPAHELFVLQGAILPIPKEILESDEAIRSAFADYSIGLPVLVIAFVPAICEELFFRGFLLGGLRSAAGKWTAIIATAVIFAVFHFLPVKFGITAGLGVVLAYVCWNANSIWPAIIAHMLHNASAVLIAFWPTFKEALGLTDQGDLDHLPPQLIVIGSVIVVIGLSLCHNAGSAVRTKGKPNALDT